jgi:hypothetical protein
MSALGGQMSVIQIVAASIGVLIIGVTVWQIAKNGIAKNTGAVDGVNSHDLSQGGDGFS